MIDCYKSHLSYIYKRDYEEKIIEEHLVNFKQQISIFNANFLSSHLKGKVVHFWVTYRNPDDNWYSKSYVAKLDDEAMNLCSRDPKNGKICVMGSLFWDEYLTDLLNDYEKCFENEEYSENDEIICSEYLLKWKENILIDYNVVEHIKRLIATLKVFYKDEVYPIIQQKTKEFFPDYNLNFKEINARGLLLEILDFDVLASGRTVRAAKIKRIHGLFGGYPSYDPSGKQILPNNERIVIPPTVYSHGFGTFGIAEIGEGVFENLDKMKELVLPHTIKRISWSFWNCSNLESICIDNEYPYQKRFFKSIDGVLYNEDGTELLVFPNKHGVRYEVPEGVKRIGNRAFKTCTDIEELVLPSTLESIGINAFYRCVNLKRIIVNKEKDSIQIDKPFGSCGDVHPLWYWLA